MVDRKPILIAFCIAIAIIVGAYFIGQSVFETERPFKTAPVTATQKIAPPNTPTKPIGVESKTETPATNSERITRVTEQPVPTVDIEVDNTPTEAETPTNTSNHESDDSPTNPALSERLRERLRLFNAVNALHEEIDSYGELPRKEDFKNYDDYSEALGKYLDAVIPLSEQADELHKQYIRISSTPESFAKTATLFREQIRQHEPDITDEEIKNFIKELKPQ